MILWFLYAGYLVLRKMDMPRERQANLCAVVGIVAFVDEMCIRDSVYSVIWQQLSGIVHKEQRNEPNLHTAADLRKGRFQSVCT